MDCADAGVVLRHGAPFDNIGARDVIVWSDGPRYYMHYDAAGPTGWLVALAESDDLVHWQKRGTVLQLGKPGDLDSGTASYGVPFKHGDAWHLFYIGTPNTMPPPERTPAIPYQTMKAKSDRPTGPWIKQPDVIPYRCAPNTYYSDTACPGPIIERDGEFLQFFSAAAMHDGVLKRTLGIARTKNLNGAWIIDPKPILPPDEQIENTSLYYQEKDRTWFLFTNHIGISRDAGEYTDAIWVYWSKDLERWNTNDRAVVLDGRNCTWSKRVIGLPSVVPHGDRLALFYDGVAGDSASHVGRDIGLAWLKLPLPIPSAPR
jgi:hypothetical protein